MKTLIDTVAWRSAEHPDLSRGMSAAGAGFLAGHSPELDLDLSEEFSVMTRKQTFLFLNFSRTTVFSPSPPLQGGILWWNTKDEALLATLHKKVVDICAEVGFSEVHVMCESKGHPRHTTGERCWPSAKKALMTASPTSQLPCGHLSKRR